MPAHLERLHWPADRLATHQRDRLRVLLRHAIEHSPFHARRLGPIVEPDHFELSGLAALPTMTKPEMMEAFDEVVTDRRLRLATSNATWRSHRSEPTLLLDEYVCLASGGSSGLRGVFVQRLGEFADLAASIMRPAMARQIAAGSTGDRHRDRRRHGDVAGTRQRLRSSHAVRTGALQLRPRHAGDP